MSPLERKKFQFLLALRPGGGWYKRKCKEKDSNRRDCFQALLHSEPQHCATVPAVRIMRVCATSPNPILSCSAIRILKLRMRGQDLEYNSIVGYFPNVGC